VANSLGDRFVRTATWRHERRLTLTHDEVRTLVGMGPSARHVDPAELDRRIAALATPVTTTAAVRVGVWRPTGTATGGT